jgi:hypothetical protein
MMQPDSKRPVTLEDILRLKRAERPPAEFWTQFDKELRAKQLAALVEKRPWWKTVSFSQVFAGFRRYHLPIGATAVLAVTVFSVREYRAPRSSAPVTPAPATEVSPSSTVAALTTTPAAATVAPAALAPMRIESASAPKAQAVAATAPPAAEHSTASKHFVLSSEATPDGNLAQMIPGVGAPTTTGTNEDLSPSARLIAENVAALQSTEPILSTPAIMASVTGFEARTAGRSKPVEPLSQMKVPSGSRRSNMIASATLISTTAPVVTGEHAARGLSDERLYESISRINARGAGMLVKF